MNISVICVGKIKEAFFKDALKEYEKRLSKYCKLTIFEVADEKIPDKSSDELERQIKQKEGERILKFLKEDTYVIPLAIEGKKYTSLQFSEKISKLGINGKSNITFIIGGSLGLHNNVLRKADELLSFSDMTFPHQLMRVILLEQIYRCFRIQFHEPYHK